MVANLVAQLCERLKKTATKAVELEEKVNDVFDNAKDEAIAFTRSKRAE